MPGVLATELAPAAKLKVVTVAPFFFSAMSNELPAGAVPAENRRLLTSATHEQVVPMAEVGDDRGPGEGERDDHPTVYAISAVSAIRPIHTWCPWGSWSRWTYRTGLDLVSLRTLRAFRSMRQRVDPFLLGTEIALALGDLVGRGTIVALGEVGQIVPLGVSITDLDLVGVVLEARLAVCRTGLYVVQFSALSLRNLILGMATRSPSVRGARSARSLGSPTWTHQGIDSVAGSTLGG